MATYNYTSSTLGTVGHPSNAAVPYVITSQVIDAVDNTDLEREVMLFSFLIFLLIR